MKITENADRAMGCYCWEIIRKMQAPVLNRIVRLSIKKRRRKKKKSAHVRSIRILSMYVRVSRGEKRRRGQSITSTAPRIKFKANYASIFIYNIRIVQFVLLYYA